MPTPHPRPACSPSNPSTGNSKPVKNVSSAKHLSGAVSGASIARTSVTGASSVVDSDDQRLPLTEYYQRSNTDKDEGSSGGGTILSSDEYVTIGGDEEEHLRTTVSLSEKDLEGGNKKEVAGVAPSNSVQEKEKGWLKRSLSLRLPMKGDMLIYVGFLLNVKTKGTISCFETLGAEYAMTHLGLTSAEVRIPNSFLQNSVEGAGEGAGELCVF